jgi:hypothetical protein
LVDIVDTVMLLITELKEEEEEEKKKKKKTALHGHAGAGMKMSL